MALARWLFKMKTPAIYILALYIISAVVGLSTDNNTSFNMCSRDYFDKLEHRYVESQAQPRARQPEMSINHELVVGWRMKRTQGIVECLLRGDSETHNAFIYPVLTSNADHIVSLLPNPIFVEKGNYAVRCLTVANIEVGLSDRWMHPNKGPEFGGLILQSNSTAKKCSRILSMLNGNSLNKLNEYLESIKPNECPGIVIETTIDGQGPQQYRLNNAVMDFPPAVVRVHTSHTLQQDQLPLCNSGETPGRWLPTKIARDLVLNGVSIPNTVSRYWVPYSCRITHWDLLALKDVRNNVSSELTCDLTSLTNVVFTGSSTESALLSSFRQYVLNESTSRAARNKERDHLREQDKQIVASSEVTDSELDLSFSLFPLMMPLITDQDPSTVLEEFRDQVRNITRLKPSAIVMHIGLHEVCGAYGPGWWGQVKKHAPCATREELIQAYRYYAEIIKNEGFAGKTIFRSMMGSFPDSHHQHWRWTSFANCKDIGKYRATKAKSNPCLAVASPVSQVMFSNDDARRVWSGEFNIAFIDAFSVVHSSPTSDEGFPDGLHPQASSNEAIAINQLIMNTLCHLTSPRSMPLLSIRPADAKLDIGQGSDNLPLNTDSELFLW